MQHIGASFLNTSNVPPNVGIKAISVPVNIRYFLNAHACPIVPYFLCRIWHDWLYKPHLVEQWESGQSWSEGTQVQMASSNGRDSNCQKGLKHGWRLLLFININSSLLNTFVFVIFLSTSSTTRMLCRRICSLLLRVCQFEALCAGSTNGCALAGSISSVVAPMIQSFLIRSQNTPLFEVPWSKILNTEVASRLCLWCSDGLWWLWL